MDDKKLIEFSQKLIQTKSFSGAEREIAGIIKNEMQTLGYDKVWIDNYGSVIGKITGNGNKSILFDGHMDTVEIPDVSKWSIDPFAGTIKDGKLYGRGASDMKCALAAMIYGVADLKQKNIDLDGDVYVTATVFEEIFEGIALGNILDELTPDCVIIGEASQLKLKIGQRGRAEIVIETTGKNAHSANPDKGINSILKMNKLVEEIEKLETQTHPKLGNGIIVLTDIISSPYPGASVIPDKCRVTYDRRLLVNETKESVLAPINECIDMLSKKDPEFIATAKYAEAEATAYTKNNIKAERFFPGWLLDEQSDVVEKAVAGIKESGIEPIIDYYSFCTNGSESCGNRNIPTIGIGPSLENLAHTVDEYIELSQITQAGSIYFNIAKSLL